LGSRTSTAVIWRGRQPSANREHRGCGCAGVSTGLCSGYMCIPWVICSTWRRRCLLPFPSLPPASALCCPAALSPTWRALCWTQHSTLNTRRKPQLLLGCACFLRPLWSSLRCRSFLPFHFRRLCCKPIGVRYKHIPFGWPSKVVCLPLELVSLIHFGLEGEHFGWARRRRPDRLRLFSDASFRTL
jgi:hypothetical protein